MRVWVIGSGSSGNALIVEASGERLVIDAGIGPRVCVERMRALGGEFIDAPVRGIIVTHHHGDHASKIEPLARALRAPVYFHRGIDLPVAQGRLKDLRRFDVDASLALGAFNVSALPVPHDAPQIALRVETGGLAFAIATDLGHVPHGLAPFLASCDVVLLESNYCPELLAVGPYPPHLRNRVAGKFGHLANEDAASLASQLRGTRVSRLYLGHVSRANNTLERALAVVRAKAGPLPVEVIPRGLPFRFDVGHHTSPRRPVQLSLAL